MNLVSHDPITLLNKTALIQEAFKESWPGNGTKFNPYIISNYSFSTGQSGIEIRDLSDYIIVEFNSISQGNQYGIYVQNVPNLEIKNNYIAKTTSYAIHIVSSKGYIANNNISYNYGIGIGLMNAKNVTILENSFDNNLGSNFYVDISTNITVQSNKLGSSESYISMSFATFQSSNNIFFNNNVLYQTAFSDINSFNFFSQCSDIIFSNNIGSQVSLEFENSFNLNFYNNVANKSFISFINDHGDNIMNNTFLLTNIGLSNEENTSIRNNNFFDNTTLSIARSSSTIIQYNNFEDNENGVTIESSYNEIIIFNYFVNQRFAIKFLMVDGYVSTQNVLYGNNFIYNETYFDLSNSQCSWDNESYGNYWSTYNGIDSDNNGIGDSSFNVSLLSSTPVTNQTDFYPLMNFSYTQNLTKLINDEKMFAGAIPNVLVRSEFLNQPPIQSTTSQTTTNNQIQNTTFNYFGYISTSNYVDTQPNSSSGLTYVIILLAVAGFMVPATIFVSNMKKKKETNSSIRTIPSQTEVENRNSFPNYNQRTISNPNNHIDAQVKKSINFCFNCGKVLEFEDIFCYNCGSKVR